MAKILVIDNEASSRDYLRLHLETAGHQVFVAEDAIAGLRLAVSIRPDLILSGADKPGMDSAKLLSALRSNKLTAPTPIILLSTLNDRDSIRQVLDQGADDYLSLPVTRETLLQTVAVRLRQPKAVRDVGVNTIPPAATPSLGTRTDPAAAQALRSTSGMTSTTGYTARSAGMTFYNAGTPQEGRYGTVLFSDIRNFLTLAEVLSTAEVAEVLNAYFVRACEPILQQGGWIVKLLGDGVLAMFEPTARNVADHAERALRAALFHVIVAQRFNTWLTRRFPDRRLPDFAVGIGVHTGDVVVVRVNTGAGVDTTIIGDTVNVASRLEEQTKKLGASVVTTLETLGQAGARFIPGKRGSLLIRGRNSPVEITEIVGLRPRQNADMRSLHTYEMIKEAVAKNASFIMRVRDQVLAEPHRLRSTGQFTPLRPSDAPIKIPGYKLVRRLGQGGMSRSFLAEYEPTGAVRVLKVLNINEGGFDLLQRFVQEHDIISQARHPSVATIYGHGQTDSHAYIVMEYFAGGDLRERMHEALPPGLALDYLRQVTEALVAIHGQGIVHRDLKPDNLMLRDDGSLALADFGIAKNLASTLNRTRQGEGLGTPFYLSPEQALGKKVDQRCDLYSMGVMFFEMLTGERPYAGEDPPTLLNKHIHSPVPRLPMRFERLQPLLEKLMAKRPEERFDSAQAALIAIREQLDAIGAGLEGEAMAALAEHEAIGAGAEKNTKRAGAEENAIPARAEDHATRVGAEGQESQVTRADDADAPTR
jgi:class 3 adenylate cyclase/CheY-like chemotaxis protein